MDPPPLMALVSMDLLLEEALRTMARAVERFRSLGERQMRRLLLGAGAGAGDHVSGKLRDLATQLEQIRDLVWGAQLAEDGWSSPAKETLCGIEDLFDEMEYHKLKFQVETTSSKTTKVSNPLASALKLGRRFVGSSGDEGSTSRFRKDLDSVASTLGALLKEARGSNLQLAVFDSTGATTAPHQDHKLFGRNKEVNDIVQMLTEPLPSPSPTIQVIPIVGMGGLGKTTLAHSVYNDARVKRHFDLRIWVLVSARFDKVQLAKDILRSANPAYHGSVGKDVTFEALQLKLTQFLASKRVLIALDDIWYEAQDTWQQLLITLKPSAESGSRIIVTTRTPKVADMLGTSQTYHLNPLGIEDSWSLFHRYAFRGWSTHDSSDELEQIGRTIVAKANGLPLAVKVLGGLLGATKSTVDWRIILEKEFSRDVTLSSLQLSYNYLPGRLKQCFLFCGIFPKNWKFDQRSLIHFWMAHGFIQSQNGTGKRMEDVGTDYFNTLLSRSFFQTLREGSRTHYMMHDLIHDLAVSISANECRRIELGITCPIPPTVRHLSVTMDGENDISAAMNMLPKNLRTFLVLKTRSFSSNSLQDDFVGKFKTLRVLHLSHSGLTELPRAISRLSHLRYLSLGPTIRSLPDSICKLLHLQALDFTDKSSIGKLPAGISNLAKLRHLEIDMRCIARVPGFGRLVNLQGSVELCVKKGGGHTLQELNGMNCLRGQLKIKGLDNVLSKDEATKTDMRSKENLMALTLEWSSASRVLNPVSDYEVLENLQPHQNLKELHIVRYLGATAPSWLQLASLRELQSLHLVNCRSLGVLPPLGLLPSLKQLRMKELCTVKRIGREFYGTDDMAFPSLKVLVFDEFPSLVEWSEARANPFPCLERLEILDCPKLIQVPSFPPSVFDLKVERTLLISNMRLGPYSSSRLEMLTLDISTTSVLCRGLFHQSHLEAVIVLNINAGNKQLVDAEGLQSFKSLQKLQLCHSDISDQSLGSLLQVLPSLYSFVMMDLPNMTSLLVSGKTSLCTAVTELQISNCPLLSSLVSLDTFISLKRLVIEKCPKLTAASFPINFWRLTALKVLSISYCTELQSFPACGLPTSIEAVHLVGCHPKLHEKSSNRSVNY
uniref:Uncharacterized protein n=1 Tax=Avena sativa TaxID=4498 RepID=A0ACD5Z126_AVESA